MRKAIILFLFVLTVINLSAFLIPQLCGCSCYYPDASIKCRGDCCGGSAAYCDCYEFGADNCIPPRN
jgi:hypothetical protein